MVKEQQEKIYLSEIKEILRLLGVGDQVVQVGKEVKIKLKVFIMVEVVNDFIRY